MTGRELVEGAMRLLGAIASGENASSSEADNGLEAANGIIDSWSNERLFIFQRVRESFPFVASQQAYTMGTGGNFNTSRPIAINEASVLDSNGNETPVEIINELQWASIQLKSQQIQIPWRLYVENTYPLLTLRFWPVPSTTFSAVLYSQKPLTQIASLNTELSLPPGYERALKYNLAIELAPEFERTPSAEVYKGASESKSAIKRQNSPVTLAVPDTAGVIRRGRFNIYTGGYS